MTGVNRFKLSCRTLLIFLALLGMPVAARSGTLEDSAREFARKIAAALPARESVSVDVRNNSTLTQGEVDRISQAFSGVLQGSGFSISLNNGGAVHVSVTLSENMKGFLWSAEISQGDATRVVLMAVPRILEDRPVPNSMPIALSSEKFWEGPEQVLDAVEMTTPNDTRTLFLLQPDGLVIRNKEADSSFKVEIPLAQAVTRTPFGAIQDENACRLLEFMPCVVVTLNAHICTIAMKTRAVVECHGPPRAIVPYDPLLFIPRSFPRGRSEPLTQMSGHCGTDIQFGTGIGDYTQPDSVQAFEPQGTTYVSLSNELSFPGPVIALHVIDHVPRAIVRNLETENYEAYRISISCGQ